LASGARRLRRVALQAIVSRVTAEISLARSHMPCQSLKYFPKRILSGDLSPDEFKQVDSPHFYLLP
jgi:hypothetical protein